MKQIIKNKQSLFLAQKKKLREAGYEDFKETTKLLFSEAYGIPLNESYNYQTNKEMDKHDNIFLSMVNRRAVGEPTSHIIRSRSFWKDDFYIEETVLDPRPESEMIIEFTRKQLFDGMKVLDLGCGSGCIGLSIHRENPEISLTLSDVSNKALSVAKKNALELKIDCKFIHSSLFSNINEKFDLIVANLPYVEGSSFLNLQREIILYEPHEALYGGICGVDIIKLFLSEVGNHLKAKGRFVMEFGEGQDTLIKQELLRYKFSNFDFHRDLNGINRILCVINNT